METSKKTIVPENKESLDARTTIGEVEGTSAPTPSMLIESPYGFLMSISLVANEDGYFYDREYVRYVRTGKGHYIYKWMNSILESVPTPSPTLSEGVSTLVASAMVEKALQYTSPLPLSAIGGSNVNEEQEAVCGEVTEDIT